MKTNKTWLIFLFVLLITNTNCKNGIIKYKPIGYFSSKYTIETGAPRQGRLYPESKGVIILDTIYIKGLKELDKLEYIWVISHFHETKGWESIISPPPKRP